MYSWYYQPYLSILITIVKQAVILDNRIVNCGNDGKPDDNQVVVIMERGWDKESVLT